MTPDPAVTDWTEATRIPASREWAAAFLAEWHRPYFGPDSHDALANVQRAAAVADKRGVA